jgi:hypothetical protein
MPVTPNIIHTAKQMVNAHVVTTRITVFDEPAIPIPLVHGFDIRKASTKDRAPVNQSRLDIPNRRHFRDRECNNARTYDVLVADRTIFGVDGLSMLKAPPGAQALMTSWRLRINHRM